MAITYGEMVGLRFGRLTVLERLPNNKAGYAVFLCQCDCGRVRNIHGDNLRKGLSKSCGCLKKELTAKRNNQLYKLPDGEAARNSLFNRYVQGAQRREIEFSLSIDEFAYLTKQPCFYCGCSPSNVATPSNNAKTGDYIYNGIDRYDNSIGYIYQNCVACCKTCNLAKNSMSFDEFISWIERVHQHVKEI